MKRGVRVLVVDDDRAVRSAMRVNLEKAGIETALVRCAEDALERLAAEPFDLVFTDVRMPGLGGIALLEQIRQRWPDTSVVVMTGYGNVEDAVTAMKEGAAEYLIKPVSKNVILLIIDRILEARALRNEVVALRKEVRAQRGIEAIVGNSASMLRVFEQVQSVADTQALVLIQGETGTGKELVAQAIHLQSPRRSGPFVRVNCAALPDTLLENELFGHERGAFTGASRVHAGRFEQAQGGTIFLDEIGDISTAMQVKLLHVLENGEFQRLGGQETLRVDVRIVAATNRELREEVRRGRFRQDLFYRLHVFTIRVPPLREHKEDIPLLVDHFIRRYATRNARTVERVSNPVLRVLMHHDWPGNVRELEHVVERAVILATGSEVASVEIDEHRPATAPKRAETEETEETISLNDALLDFERRLIVEALMKAEGVQARAARALGVSRSNLHYRIEKLGLKAEDYQ
jgi:DNA-binding NtrC family response regulator